MIPWQSYAADVVEERLPDGSLHYRIVIISVPRQAGKTVLVRSVGTKRAIAGQEVFYTAQTGLAARARWTDLVQALQTTPAYEGRFAVSQRGGSEHVTFRPSLGTYHAFAPSPKALHSYTPDLVVIDEAFARSQLDGDLLMGAILPAQQHVLQRQIIIVSTMGTAESTWLHGWLDRAVAGLPRTAVLWWGCAEDADPYSLDDITRFHPGVGYPLGEVTLSAADILAEVDNHTRAEYERAYCNRRTVTGTQQIPVDLWRALAAEDLQRPATTTDVVLGYDVAVDRQAAAIVAAWPHHGKIAVKPVRHGPGTGWLDQAVAQLADAWRPRAVVAVRNGPVIDHTARLVESGVDVDELNEHRYAAACGWWLEALDRRDVVHDGHLALEAGMTGLVTRGASVDGVAFSRRHSVGDSSPAIAGVVAARVASGEPGGRPRLEFAA